MTAAETLIELGAAPVEVAHPLPDGTCSCRLRGECPAPGKHPIGRGWMRTALMRRERQRRIPAFVRLAPVTSYGVIPTVGSRLMGIDVDRPDDDFVRSLPPTLAVHREVGRGHYWYVVPDDIDLDLIPRTFAFGEVAVAASRFLVGPGCRHASGTLYEATDANVSFATPELIDALRAFPAVRRGSDGAIEAVEGSRHSWLVAQARKLAGWGWDQERIEARLRELNDELCRPPLTEAEAEYARMADWATRTIAPDRVPTITRRTTTWEVVRP